MLVYCMLANGDEDQEIRMLEIGLMMVMRR